MADDNIHHFPNVPGSLVRREANKLRQRFIEGGRAQRLNFEHLSRHIEQLVEQAKAHGERSGAMKRAFGEGLVPVKGRFTAKNGVPPQQLYQTPAAWLTVLKGLAVELDMDPDRALIEAFEGSALCSTGTPHDVSRASWLSELYGLLSPLADRLNAETDLLALSRYVADAGLYLEDGHIAVYEWPGLSSGFDEGVPYSTSAISLVPHIFSVNFNLIAYDWSNPDDPNDLARLDSYGITEKLLPSEHARVASFDARQAIRIGVAMAVKKDEVRADLALLEWHVAEVELFDENGCSIRKLALDIDTQLPGRINGQPGDFSEPADETAASLPSHWLSNSVRIHFPGSTGFERLAAAPAVEPWSLEAIWNPGASDGETFPLACPGHTTAGIIEGNLLYADSQGQLEERIDVLLLADIKRVTDAVERFRSANRHVRDAARSNLLAEWSAATVKPKSL